MNLLGLLIYIIIFFLIIFLLGPFIFWGIIIMGIISIIYSLYIRYKLKKMQKNVNDSFNQYQNQTQNTMKEDARINPDVIDVEYREVDE